MTLVKNYFEDFLHLFFPHTCTGCGTDVLNNEDAICAHCLTQLPETDFLAKPANPVEKYFTEDYPFNMLPALSILIKIHYFSILLFNLNTEIIKQRAFI